MPKVKSGESRLATLLQWLTKHEVFLIYCALVLVGTILVFLTDLENDLKALVSFVSACVSVVSLFATRHFWFASNRPIVCAALRSDEPMPGCTYFNLVIYNSGNRPAANIKLFADQQDLDNAVNHEANQDFVSMIYECFSKKAVTPLLLNGEKIIGAFGAVSDCPEQDVLKYEAEIPIKIIYFNLEQRKYISDQVLYVRQTETFGESLWEPRTKVKL